MVTTNTLDKESSDNVKDWLPDDPSTLALEPLNVQRSSIINTSSKKR